MLKLEVGLGLNCIQSHTQDMLIRLLDCQTNLFQCGSSWKMNPSSSTFITQALMKDTISVTFCRIQSQVPGLGGPNTDEVPAEQLSISVPGIMVVVAQEDEALDCVQEVPVLPRPVISHPVHLGEAETTST